MPVKYVKDFEFPSSAGFQVQGTMKRPQVSVSKSVGGGDARLELSAGKDNARASFSKKFAKGGVHEDVKMDKAMVKTAVHKHEGAMHPGKPMTKLARGGMKPAMSAMARKQILAKPTMEKKEMVSRQSAKAPAGGLEMLRDSSALGIKNNKNPGIKRRAMPVAPREPMISAYNHGGKKK